MQQNRLVSQIDAIIQSSINNKFSYLPPETMLDDLGIDSIERIEILVKLQKNLAIKIEFDEFQMLKTLNQVHQYIEKNIKN